MQARTTGYRNSGGENVGLIRGLIGGAVGCIAGALVLNPVGGAIGGAMIAQHKGK